MAVLFIALLRYVPKQNHNDHRHCIVYIILFTVAFLPGRRNMPPQPDNINGLRICRLVLANYPAGAVRYSSPSAGSLTRVPVFSSFIAGLLRSPWAEAAEDCVSLSGAVESSAESIAWSGVSSLSGIIVSSWLKVILISVVAFEVIVGIFFERVVEVVVFVVG